MGQLEIFNENHSSGNWQKVQDGEYLYIADFYDRKNADTYYQSFFDNIKWEQKEMMMYGRKVAFPRLTAWYGDEGKSYSYSGLTFLPQPWTVDLLEVKEAVEKVVPLKFNSVLLNLYRDGSDSMGWHADDEKELGYNPVIASINLGASRKFQLRHNETNEKIELILEHGSLLIMKGSLQHYWKHQVPKTKKKVGSRINLTFRVIKG